MMMKMHGLGDGAYWLVTYTWFAALYVVYMAIFIAFGSLIGLNMFTKNSLGVQVGARGAQGGRNKQLLRSLGAARAHGRLPPPPAAHQQACHRCHQSLLAHLTDPHAAAATPPPLPPARLSCTCCLATT